MRALRILALGVLFLAACGDSDSTDLDAELRDLIESHELTGNPAQGLELPSIDEPLAVLGRRLFFSKTLGGDEDTACASCHHPTLGGGDAMPLPVGVGADEPDLLGPGRSHEDGDFTVPRNSPSTFNIALFEKGLFWDSRVELMPGSPAIRTPDSDFGTADPNAGDSLTAAQARFPVTSQEEMRGFSFMVDESNEALRDALVQRLAADDRWVSEFETAFGSDEISYARIAEAMAAYEQSQLFIDAPWRAYVQGDDDAIGESAKRGALLFFADRASDGMSCVSCHSGDRFSDEAFHSVGAPQIGRGKGDGTTETHDYGRERETGKPGDRFAFRTPSLWNVSATAPYFHAGTHQDLAGAVRQHLDPKAALSAYDGSELPALAVLDLEANTTELLQSLEDSPLVIQSFAQPFDYDEQDLEDLVAFLQALTDPCVQDRGCLQPWIADAEIDDVDGNLLVAVDRDGDPL